jgi:hypothetical protein
MSFRLFIYYCALCGGWAAFLGWCVGKPLGLAPDPDVHAILSAAVKGMWLGLLVALGLSLVDALWNLSLKRFAEIGMRVGVALLVGAVGGLFGGLVGQWLLSIWAPFYVFGWTLTGCLIGASIGVFEVLASLVNNKDVLGAQKKIIKSLIGGTVGGVLGGILSLLLRSAWVAIIKKDENALWSPTATGFVALGMCIGLLIGLAQVILKEAWIKVEAGFRAGREMILSKEKTTVGRAEACDIGLFGDPAVEKLHAQIVLAGNRYYLEDANTPAGTFINDQPVRGRMPLSSGDLIRVGKSQLRFRERQKRTR